MTGRSDNSWISYNQTMPLMFYILYTPDTVHFLLGLAQTLLVDPQIKLCLVANGCRRAEIALLERFCLAHPACQTMVLSQTEVLPHGLAMEKLLQACQEEYFCFMDSDILASDPFLASFLPHLAGYSALISCAPVWNTPADLTLPDKMNKLDGRYLFDQAGSSLGGTYFAIYHRQTLLKVLNETGISLHWQEWDQIPAPVQAELELAGLRFEWYDTTKVLTLLYRLRGLGLKYIDCPALHHLGGLSWTNLRSAHPDEESLRASILPKLPPLHRLDLRRKDGTPLPVSPAERAQLEQSYEFWHGRDRAMHNAGYFVELLKALQAGENPPDIPSGLDPQVTAQAAAARQIILAEYPAYLSWLASV